MLAPLILTLLVASAPPSAKPVPARSEQGRVNTRPEQRPQGPMVDLLVLTSGDELAKKYPCPPPNNPRTRDWAEQVKAAQLRSARFCLGGVEVTLTATGRQFIVAILTMLDPKTGEILLQDSVVGLSAAVDEPRLCFWSTGEPLTMRCASANKPSAPPVRVASCECGTEGDPFFSTALLGNRCLCLSRGGAEEQSGELRLKDGSSTLEKFGDLPECVIPQPYWTKNGSKVSVRADSLSPTCRRLLRLGSK